MPKAPVLTVTPGKVIMGARALAYAQGPSGARFAATLEDRSVRIYDAATRQTIRVFQGHPQPAYAIAWTRDGAFLATGDESGRIMIWNANTGQKLQEVRTHIRGIQALDWDASSKYLISTGKDDVVKVWERGKNKELHTIPGQGVNFYSATFIGATPQFGVGFLGTGARIYSAPNAKVQNFLTGHNGEGIFDIDFNSAGTRAVTAGRDGTGAIWDMKTYKRLNSLRGHTDQVIHATFSPDGRFVATSSPDRTVRVWNAANYQPVTVLENHTAVGSPLVFTKDGKYLVTVNFDDFIQINELKPALAPSSAPVKKPAPARKRGG
ncbi:MAG TPA: WD40 repeat domain-containing protein [Fimbriimonadaceae bacterium]|nr:WD40 repeat domain-containing protein [Fimbriimonadaceae bacterium]